MNPNQGESELLQQSLAGSKEAFGSLVQRYQSLVCAVTYSATGSVEHSEELAQETFLRAWKNLGQLSDPARFKAWLCTIARNLGSHAIRRRARDATDEAGKLTQAADTADQPSPPEVLISKERQEIVWSALRDIPDQYREPMVLYYRNEQSISQVAADLGLTEHAVRQRLYRGRQLLKAQVSAVVEDTLTRSGPSKAFAVAVVAALPALTAQTASAAAATIAAKSAKGVPMTKALFAGGLSGAVLGPILGFLGGCVGAWFSIKNTKSPRERRFMIKMTVLLLAEILVLAGVVGLCVVLAAHEIVPWRAYWVVLIGAMVIHFALLGPAIMWANRRQRQIQVEDGTYQAEGSPSGRLTKQAAYGSFGGAIFGSLLWIIVVADMTGDWLIGIIVLVLGGSVFAACLKALAVRPDRYWRAALVAVLGVGAINTGVIILRWRLWLGVPAFREAASGVPGWLVAALVAASVAALAGMAIWKDRKGTGGISRGVVVDSLSDSPRVTRSGIYGSFAGTIFGSTGWLFMMSLTARDWAVLAVVIACVLVLFVVSVRLCLRATGRLWGVLLADVGALYALHLIVLNLRWGHWAETFARTQDRWAYSDVSLSVMTSVVTGIAGALVLFFGLRWAANRWLQNQRDDRSSRANCL